MKMKKRFKKQVVSVIKASPAIAILGIFALILGISPGRAQAGQADLPGLFTTTIIAEKTFPASSPDNHLSSYWDVGYKCEDRRRGCMGAIEPQQRSGMGF